MASGKATGSSILAGMDWILVHKRRPAVVSMSFTGPRTQAFRIAASQMLRNNIVMVGAIAPNDVISAFSNYGPCVDIFAPGSSVLSAGIDDDNSVATKSGTSMACPAVAGAVAVIWSNEPGFDRALATPDSAKGERASGAEVTKRLLKEAAEGVVRRLPEGTPNRLLQVPRDEEDALLSTQPP